MIFFKPGRRTLRRLHLQVALSQKPVEYQWADGYKVEVKPNGEVLWHYPGPDQNPNYYYVNTRDGQRLHYCGDSRVLTERNNGMRVFESLLATLWVAFFCAISVALGVAVNATADVLVVVCASGGAVGAFTFGMMALGRTS
jgi:hypothetical protein